MGLPFVFAGFYEMLNNGSKTITDRGMIMVQKVVVLTGAGISAESGLSTFRGNGGLWEDHRIEDVATPEAYARDPQLVQRFYNMRRAQLKDPGVSPNLAHKALAEFEKNFSGDLFLVTQNVDNLHERGGSQNVLHMHGELAKVRCTSCKSVMLFEKDIHHGKTQCPNCGETKSLRPHIVWFGEIPIGMSEIEEKLKECDLFLAIGTSGQVYPAAAFVQMATSWGGARAVEFNLEGTPVSDSFHETILGPAGETLGPYLQRLME